MAKRLTAQQIIELKTASSKYGHVPNTMSFMALSKKLDIPYQTVLYHVNRKRRHALIKNAIKWNKMHYKSRKKLTEEKSLNGDENTPNTINT